MSSVPHDAQCPHGRVSGHVALCFILGRHRATFVLITRHIKEINCLPLCPLLLDGTWGLIGQKMDELIWNCFVQLINGVEGFLDFYGVPSKVWDKVTIVESLAEIEATFFSHF